MKFLIAAVLVAAAALPATAQTRDIKVGPSGLMERSNRTDLEPIKLTAGSLKSSGPYKLLSGGYYRIDIESDGTSEIAVEGPDFFRNVWVNEVVVNDIEIRPMGMSSIEFDEEGTARISFVAIRPGTYDLRIPGSTGESQKAVFVVE